MEQVLELLEDVELEGEIHLQSGDIQTRILIDKECIEVHFLSQEALSSLVSKMKKGPAPSKLRRYWRYLRTLQPIKVYQEGKLIAQTHKVCLISKMLGFPGIRPTPYGWWVLGKIGSRKHKC